MTYSRVNVFLSAMRFMRAEIRRAHGLETGGALVGMLQGETLHVIDACGPGPNSKLTRFDVTIDGEYATNFCDRAFESSGGALDYVGDWHCHTGWSLEPSARDRKAMAQMASFATAVRYHPVSLILGRCRRWRAYHYCGRLVRIDQASTEFGHPRRLPIVSL